MGTVGAFQGILIFFTTFCGLGTATAIVREIYDIGEENIGEFIFTVIFLSSIVTIATVFCIQIIPNNVEQIFKIKNYILYLL